RRIGRWRPFLPWPVQCFALALVLVLLVPAAWRVMKPGHAVAADSMRADPEQAWRNAIAGSIHGRLIHGFQGTRALLEALYDLPVNAGGWRLLQAECAPNGTRWRCRARYERRQTGASNQSLMDSSRAGWTLEFASLEQAEAAWETPAGGVPLAHQRLADGKENERRFVSALQGVQGGFAQLRVGKALPLPVSAPLDGQGRPIARPAHLPAYASRPVQVIGPLRSAGLLLPHLSSVAWNKAVLTLRELKTPGARDSGLTLTLQGVLYETENPAAS
ncbi:MAG: hypothetical protein WBA83_13925, partial [Burkholderiaceae bacterium]